MVATGHSTKAGSQFYITVRNTSHYNGRHLVFGRVVKGMGIVKGVHDTEQDDDHKPKKVVMIADCGEYPKGTMDYNTDFADGTEDTYPNYPEDLDLDFALEKNSKRVLDMCSKIKTSGNGFYKSKHFGKGDNKLQTISEPYRR